MQAACESDMKTYCGPIKTIRRKTKKKPQQAQVQRRDHTDQNNTGVGSNLGTKDLKRTIVAAEVMTPLTSRKLLLEKPNSLQNDLSYCESVRINQILTV